MVYLIKCPATKLYKIGKANNLQRRFVQLQTGSAAPLSIVCTGRGGHAEESELHMRLKNLRVRGEWFRLRPWHVAFVVRYLGGTPKGLFKWLIY